MNKHFLSILCALAAFVSAAKASDTDVSGMTNAIYANGIKTLPGQTATVSIQMKNQTANTISGFQFSLDLNSSLTYVASSAQVSSARATASNFTLTVRGTQTLGMVCYSPTSATFDGTSGEVATIQITAPSTPGDYYLKASNATLTTKTGAEYDCGNVESTVHVHGLTKTEAHAATCTATGNNAYWTCSVCNKVYSDAAATTETTVAAQTIAATGHSYGTTPTWTWTGYTAATAKVACTHDASHVLSATATITSSVTKQPTCTATGVKTYTAKATLNGKEYTNTKTETLAAKGHTLVKTEAHAATCTATGNNAYWTCSVCNKVYSDANATTETTVAAQTIVATGHSYGTTPTWTWTGYTAATATFTCTSDNATHVEEGVITNAVTTQPTCTTKGVRTYTAKVTFENADYSNQKTEDVNALGHNLSYSSNGDGTHTVTCSRCDYHTTQQCTKSDGVCTVCGGAVSVSDGAFHYILHSSDHTAVITNATGGQTMATGSYSGVITLPTTVIIQGETYTVTGVGQNAFSGCSNLTELHVVSDDVMTADATAFSDIKNTCHLYVPALDKPEYEESTGWKEFRTMTGILDLADGEAYVNDQTITNVDFSFTRGKFSQGVSQNVILPVSLDYEDWCEDFRLYQIYSIHCYDRDEDGEIEEMTIEMIEQKEGTHTIPNCPYIVRPIKEDATLTFSGKGKTLYPSEPEIVECSNTLMTMQFYGTYEKINMQSKGNAYGQRVDNGHWQKAGATANLSPLRVMMLLTTKTGGYNQTVFSAAPIIRCVDSEEMEEFANGIEEVTIDTLNRMMVKVPQHAIGLKPGHYTIGGKKIEVLH